MQFNPKYGFYLGILVTIEIAISHGTIGFTHAIPDAWIPAVVAWAGILAFVGSTVMTYMAAFSSAQAGPMVNLPPVIDVAKKAVVLVLAACALLFAGDAYAQAQVPRAKPTGNPIVDIGNAIKGQQQKEAATQNQSTEDLVAKLGKLALPDFEYALAMSKATGNVTSTDCWQAWVTLLTAQQKPLMGPGAPLLDSGGNPQSDNGNPVLGPPQPLKEPDPHLATAVEKISELLAALRPDSTLSRGCAALAAAGGKDAATLIQGILSGGALGLFKLPIPVVPIP